MTATKKANKKPRSREGRNTTGGKNGVRKRTVESQRSRSFAGQRSGDVVGLSNAERADSESVEELLEEGNSFEAGVVKGVEDAEDADATEVRTHQVPQDDVPDEYQDKDQAPSAPQRRLAGKSDHIDGRPRVAT
jgi:hypothetical protein